MSNLIINKEVIKSFHPCTDRWKNYLEFYSEFNGSWDEFLDLENISYDDKIWIARRVLNRNQLVHFAVLCAESVLSIYEEKYPNDKRIHDCLNYMKTIVNFSSLTSEQREKLYELRQGIRSCRYAADAADAATYAAAAYAATYAAAADAADAADAAAADAADAAAYAAYAASYASADAAYASADAAAAAYAAKTNQQNLNIQFLKMVGGL